jgi:hypothetical protein
MISVKVGNDEKPLEDASPGWITQQIERRRRDGISVCVVVSIRTSELNTRLATPECAGNGGGGGRPPNASERVVWDLWQKHGLNQAGFAPGGVAAFLAQVKHLL